MNTKRLPGLPSVSIVMPVRNEADYIQQSLSAVMEQDYPTELMEVIVADGCSTDGTRRVVSQFQEHFPRLRLIENPKRIVPAALNLAIAQARGEVIIRVDGHCEIAPDYVSVAVETLQRTGADMVGGPMRAEGKDHLAKAISLTTSTPFGVGGARFHYTNKEEYVDTVYLGICWKSLYQDIGGYDDEMVRNQDDEFSYRLLKKGGKIICNPAIRSIYYNRSTISALWRQYYQYGYWKVRVLQKHPRQMRLRQFIPPAFVASLASLAVLALFNPAGRILLGMAAGVYMLSNLAASISVAARHGWQYLPLLPVVYAVLHLSYGLGFLVGLVRFAHRWGDKEGLVPTRIDGGKQAISHVDQVYDRDGNETSGDDHGKLIRPRAQ